MPDKPKVFWVDLIESGVDPGIKTPFRLLASMAISLKRLADAQTRIADAAKTPVRPSKCADCGGLGYVIEADQRQNTRRRVACQRCAVPGTKVVGLEQ